MRPVVLCRTCGRKVAVTTGVRVLASAAQAMATNTYGAVTKWIPDEHDRPEGGRCPARAESIVGTELEVP